VKQFECNVESIKEKLLYLWVDVYPGSYAPQAQVKELYAGSYVTAKPSSHYSVWLVLLFVCYVV